MRANGIIRSCQRNTLFGTQAAYAQAMIDDYKAARRRSAVRVDAVVQVRTASRSCSNSSCYPPKAPRHSFGRDSRGGRGTPHPLDSPTIAPRTLQACASSCANPQILRKASPLPHVTKRPELATHLGYLTQLSFQTYRALRQLTSRAIRTNSRRARREPSTNTRLTPWTSP